jgi:hypothetical protein
VWRISAEQLFNTVNGSKCKDIETKANENFDNGVFFNIETKQTPSIASKLFSKRSENVYIKEFKY